MFKNKDEKRFYISRKRTECRKLILDGEQITTDFLNAGRIISKTSRKQPAAVTLTQTLIT